jgi:carbon storage regulator
MLVLTRRVGEEIIIADNIRVTVLLVDRRIVRLGITAPSSVRVMRQELRQPCAPSGAADGHDQSGEEGTTS